MEVEVPDPDWTPQPPKPIASPMEIEKPKPGLGPFKRGAVIAGGVGVVGFGLSIAAAISAVSKNASSIQVQQTCLTVERCAEGRALRQEAFASATLANVAFGIGATGAVAAIVLALWPERNAEPSAARAHAPMTILPSISLSERQAGALIIGSF